MVIFKSKLKNEVVESAKFLNDISNRFFNNYVLNEFDENNLNNDLGGSPTSIKRFGGKIIKRANPEGEDKLIDEINWYLLFKNSSLRKNLPKIYDYSTEKGNVYVVMKYYSYPSLRKIIIDNMNAKFFLRGRLEHIFYLLNNHFFTEKNSSEVPIDFVKKFHYDKLELRLKQAQKIFPDFSLILNKPLIKINNKIYINVYPILSFIKKNKIINQKLKPEKLYYSHGDLHPNNILCGISLKKMILIDCRGRNSYGSLFFDPAYDIAKILHDLRSKYSLIEKHNFSLFVNLSKKTPEFFYEFNDLNAFNNINESFEMVKIPIKQMAKKHKDIVYRADFTEGLLYLSMLIFHSKTYSEFLMCYITGIIRLNEWFLNYHLQSYEEVRKNIEK